LNGVDPGFTDPATIQTVRTWAPNQVISDPARYVPVQREMLDAITALPGVASAGFTMILPLEGGPFVNSAPVVVEGRLPEPGDTAPPRRMKVVSPGYLKAMGTRILAGRDFTWADVEAGGRVALISEDFARELRLDPAAAVGLRIRPPVDTDDWREVVGVVQSVKEDAIHTASPPVVYWPALMENAFGGRASGYPAMAYVIRSERTGTPNFMDEIREAVWAVNKDVPIALERTMQELYAGSLARTSFALVMLGIAGSMALALGVIGIYGVLAYVVTQRSREIGIRLALGAQPHEVRKMFLRQGLTLSFVGAVLGLVAALALAQLMSSLLFGVEPTDIPTYAVALGVILAAAALASYVPARRASAIDPVRTLTSE
jgi:predicted permease